MTESAAEHARVGRERRVLIAYKYVPQYREAFFNGLRSRLAKDNVRLDLVYGDPAEDETKKQDAVQLPWAIYKPSRSARIGKTFLIYQPIAKLARQYDLTIVEQANKLIVNLILLAMNKVGLARVAFWGHGKDFQGEDGRVMRSLKRFLLPHVRWFFAYNELSAAVVRDAKFPDHKITRVMNTIDNEALRTEIQLVTDDELEQLRSDLGLKGQNVCLYIGGMYDKKRLRYLFSCCELIRRQVPDFEMVFVGGGVDKPLADEFASKYEWVKSLGPVFGHAKAVTLRLAKLLLMPGLVGLVLIDAFTAEVPIVTTSVSFHSPEIEYLVSGENGVMVSPCDDPGKYADTVVQLLRDDNRLNALRQGCMAAATRYTMDAMIENFARGVLSALGENK